MNNIKIVDLLASLIKYVPRNGSDLLALLGKLWDPVLKFNQWLISVTGINLQGIINNFTVLFAKYFAIISNLISEIIKRFFGHA
ncbi:MAG: hypothetical protein M1155_02470 [Patescibacteria group bacterium]|nr:hypothetical protein [Patescibacteria group bacterium]